MINRAMEQKLRKGEAVDLSGCRRAEDGSYILAEFIEDVDYCDKEEEVWIWSIGRELATGRYLASTSAKFYQHPLFECVWLR